MEKTTITISRLSSFTLLKMMVIISLFPWFLIDAGILIFHLAQGAETIEYTRTRNSETTTEEMSLALFALISIPIFGLIGIIFGFVLWTQAVISLWLWSKVRNITISFYPSG